MNGLETMQLQCPYCGEHFSTLVDCSVSEQVYIEDCHVCCRPIQMAVTVAADGLPVVSVSHENE